MIFNSSITAVVERNITITRFYRAEEDNLQWSILTYHHINATRK